MVTTTPDVGAAAGDHMHFVIPALGPAPYLTLTGITLLAAALPLLLVRKKSRAANLRGAALIVALLLPVMAVLGSSMTHNSLEVRDGQVVVRAGYFYEYVRDIREFDLARARHGSQAAVAPQGLDLRHNGIRLPGYAAGRFSNGDAQGAAESLFVTMTDSERVVYLPATRGQSLLVSVEQGDELLQMLYDAAPAAGLQLSRAH